MFNLTFVTCVESTFVCFPLACPLRPRFSANLRHAGKVSRSRDRETFPAWGLEQHGHNAGHRDARTPATVGEIYNRNTCKSMVASNSMDKDKTMSGK
jgi:hypothetical protein